MKHTSVLSEFIRYSAMSVLGTMGVSLYILADTYFVSAGLGTNGLAALNLAIPLYNVVYGCGLCFGMGGATRYALLRAQGRHSDAEPVFTNALKASLFPVIIFVIMGIFASECISSLLGARGEIHEMTSVYLRWLLLFSPIYILNGILLSFIRNDGRPRLTMAAQLLGNAVNIVLDYIFIFPLDMGMFGAILATGFSPLVSIMLMSRHLFSKECGFRLGNTPLSPLQTKHIVSLGFPSFVTEASAGIIIILFNSIILYLSGSTGVAAYGVVANIALVITGVFAGLGQGVQPLFSRFSGMGDKRSSVKVFTYSLFSGFVFSALVYLLLFTKTSALAGIFNSENDPMLAEIAVRGLRLYFIMMPFSCFNTVCSTYFTSSDRPFPAHVISLMRGLFLLAPMAVLLSMLYKMDGVWMTVAATEAVCSVFAIIMLGRKTDK